MSRDAHDPKGAPYKTRGAPPASSDTVAADTGASSRSDAVLAVTGWAPGTPGVRASSLVGRTIRTVRAREDPSQVLLSVFSEDQLSEQPSSADRRAGFELLLPLDDQPGRSLRERLRAALKDAVRTGRLPSGARLPSTRVLAADLAMSRGVVVDAYAELIAEGFLISRPGSGTVVSNAGRWTTTRPGEASDDLSVPRAGAEQSGVLDLRPGPPDLAAFPRAAWAAAMRDVLRSLPDHELGYVAPWGSDAMRETLAGYLARVRGAMVQSPDVVVVSGVTQGLTILARVLVAVGHRSLAVESPGHASQRDILSRQGLQIVDVPVDAEGVDVDALARTPTRAVVVTPANQYPCGVLLSSARRRALIRWAEDVDGVVLEDDHDSEFRYERVPVGCLQGLSPARVALLGSVSKSLAPGLRLGWVVPPGFLRPAVRAAKRDDDFGTGVLDQHAFSRLVVSGAYDRHVRQLRQRYRERRNALVGALGRDLAGWPIQGQAAGLHVLLRLPLGVDEDALVETALDTGVAVQGTAAMYGALAPVAGLVIGYARAPAGLLDEGVRRLATAAAAVARGRGGSSRGATSRRPRGSTALDYG